MKKVRVYGKTEVWVYKIVEVEDDASADDIIDKADREFGGINSYMGNGGTDKLIGVRDDDEGIEGYSEVEFAPNGKDDIKEE